MKCKDFANQSSVEGTIKPIEPQHFWYVTEKKKSKTGWSTVLASHEDLASIRFSFSCQMLQVTVVVVVVSFECVAEP